MKSLNYNRCPKNNKKLDKKKKKKLSGGNTNTNGKKINLQDISDPTIMSQRLAEGANPHIVYQYFDKHANYKILSDDEQKCISLLLDAGADINQIENRQTVLNIVYSNIKNFDFVISKGFDTHMKIEDTPITQKIFQQIINYIRFDYEQYLGDETPGFDNMRPMITNFNKLIRINKINIKVLLDMFDFDIDGLDQTYKNFIYSNLTLLPTFDTLKLESPVFSKNAEFYDEEMMPVEGTARGEFYYNIRDVDANGQITRAFSKLNCDKLKNNPLTRRNWKNSDGTNNRRKVNFEKNNTKNVKNIR